MLGAGVGQEEEQLHIKPVDCHQPQRTEWSNHSGKAPDAGTLFLVAIFRHVTW